MTDAFVELGREVAGALGAPGLDMAVVRHPIGGLTADEVRARSRSSYPDIMAAMLARAKRPAGDPARSTPRLLDLAADAEQIDEYFHRQGWTDGLPIAVPTEARVERLLAHTRRTRADVVGIVPPRMGAATVEKIAVNAVMAGCTPECFPVVVAAVQAACSPEFNLLPMQTTTNPVAPLVIVNGPIVARLGINCADNVLGQGFRANATIGRALRFVLLNVGGGIPGKLDKACHGQPGKLSFCMAENEAASPWPPFHVERGFAPGDSTVSVIGVAGTQDIIHYARTSAGQILRTLAHAIPREGFKNLYSGGEPLIVFGPEQAAILGAAGVSKDDVRRFFFEATKVPLALLEPATVGLLRGRRAQWFASGDPVAVPIADSAHDVLILVAGGSGNHTVFLPTWGDTRCVTVRIEEP